MKMKTKTTEMGMRKTEALKMLLRFLKNHKRKSSSAGCNKKAFTIKRNADQTACLLIVKKTNFHPSANLENKGSSSVKPFHAPSFGFLHRSLVFFPLPRGLRKAMTRLISRRFPFLIRFRVVFHFLAGDILIEVPAGNQPQLKFQSGIFYAPKEGGIGEDSNFVCQAAICVADGVGGWAGQGIDAGQYARELMSNCKSEILQTKGFVDPRRVLQTAYRKTKSKGSSTACLLSMIGDSIRFANLGDSGFLLFRAKRLVYTSLQQHRFNCPFQLGSANDSPDSAYEGEIRVKDGDLVVLATDGLLDNVYPFEIENILHRNKYGDNLSNLATMIGDCALTHSVDEGFDSPFAREARNSGFDHSGGKYDDITVIVSRLVSALSSST